MVLHLFEDEQVILPTENRCLVALVNDRFDDFVRKISLDILGYHFPVQLTKADIYGQPLILEIDDWNTSRYDTVKVLHTRSAFEHVSKISEEVLLAVDEVRHYTYHVYITIVGVETQHITSKEQYPRSVVQHLLLAYLLLVLRNVEAPLLYHALQKKVSFVLCLLRLRLLVEIVLYENAIQQLGLGIVAL